VALLGVEDLSIRFGGLAALADVSFEVAEGEILGLIGPNGAGKSTVFNVLTGLYQPDAGRVTFAGESLLGLAPHTIARRGVARTFQNTEVFRPLSVVDNVLVGLHARLRAGLFGAALFYGDAVLTPAISVLSAVEGLHIGTAVFDSYVVPIAVAVLLGLFACLFLREIPLRKAHNAPLVQTPVSGPNRSRALLGLTLAFLAREVQKPQADPAIVATLSNTVNGRYPHTWSDEERARAVAQDIIEPLSITLLASSVSNGHANGAAQATERTSSEVDDTFSTGAALG